MLGFFLGGGNLEVKKNFFAFLDDSDHVKKFIFESGKRGRHPTPCGKIPTFFFLLLNPSLSSIYVL